MAKTLRKPSNPRNLPSKSLAYRRRQLSPFSRMNILISNDDGFEAPGIDALLEVASAFGDCTIVAPAKEQSGVSHQMTLWRSVEFVQHSDNVWSLDGTPSDCVRVAMTQLETRFDLVLSGINDGGNLGSDIYVSGTVAAAREAAIFGLPAIAISQHRLRFGEAFDWTNTKTIASDALKHCFDAGLTPREVININLPDVSDSKPSVKVEIIDPCPLDPNPRVAVYESQPCENGVSLKSVGKYNDRKRSSGHDVETCFSKKVSVSRLQF